MLKLADIVIQTTLVRTLNVTLNDILLSDLTNSVIQEDRINKTPIFFVLFQQYPSNG